MTKSRQELAAEGRLIIFQRMAAWREREKKTKQQRSAPASAGSPAGTDTSAHQFETRVSNPAATAAAIVAAGRKARGEVDATPSPTSSARPAANLAEQIVAAGRKARGEKV